MEPPDPSTYPDVVALAVPFFLGAMALEIGWARLRGARIYETRDTLASLLMGAGNLVEGVVLGGLGFAVLLAAHERFALVDFGWSWAAVALCFVLDDLCYYWYHRFAHESRWFWSAHVTHHSSQHYNLSTALRQTWGYTVTLGFVFELPLVVLGFHPVMLALVGGINLVYQFWIHTEAIGRFPAPIEWLMNTPSHHRVHHATNPAYLDANYAGTFIVWDRLFGTFVPEDPVHDPCRYGLVTDIATFDPIRIATHEMVALVRDVSRPGLSVGQRLRYAFGPPGYSHDGSRKTSASLKSDHARRRVAAGRIPASG